MKSGDATGASGTKWAPWGVALGPPSGCLECESRLSCSARPEEREQPAVGIAQQAVDLVELVCAPDERRVWRRQVLDPCLDRLEQREVGRKAVDLELVDALGSAQILEPVCAEVARRCVDERAGRLGEQHLSAVLDGGDARSPVDVEADVPFLGHARLAGVYAHAHADRASGEATLCFRRRGDCVGGARERHEERVALRVDLDAVVRRACLADDPAMLGERGAVPVAELVQQPCRTLDVGEEERHHSAR